MLDPMPEPIQEPPSEIPGHVLDNVERALGNCPFCGGRPWIDQGVLGHSVQCDCGARGPIFDDLFEATGAWGTRLGAPT